MTEQQSAEDLGRKRGMDDQLRIVTPCPSCGRSGLFVGRGGHLTCSRLGCNEPGVERAIQSAIDAAMAEAEKRVWASAQMTIDAMTEKLLDREHDVEEAVKAAELQTRMQWSSKVEQARAEEREAIIEYLKGFDEWDWAASIENERHLDG